MAKKREIFRQGDILFEKLSKGTDVKLVEGRAKLTSRVIAEGEATGHAHRVTGKADLYGRAWEPGPSMLVATEEVDVVHDEHATVKLGPGTYRITRQREYDPERQSVMVSD